MNAHKAEKPAIGRNREHHEELENRALAGLAEIFPGSPADNQVVDALDASDAPADDVPQSTPPAEASEAPPVTEQQVEQSAPVAPKQERRGLAHAAARALVAAAPKPQPAKTELAPDAVWEEVPLRQFLEFDTTVLGVLISAIRGKARRPVVSFVIDVEGAYSRVDFGLSMLPGPRVQMVVVGGEGMFATIFSGAFFRDELFGERDAPPPRSAKTRGLLGYLEIVLSLRDVQRGTR